MRSRRAALLGLALVLCLGACGSDDDAPSSVAEGAEPPGSGGTLVWAIPDGFRRLDPLFARSDGERLAARQLFAPLVDELSGPFDDPRRLPGLALKVIPSEDRRSWRVRLRTGVRFHDGERLNAQAVVANAERWQANPRRSGLPPEPDLFVFAPRPDQVHFRLAQPDPHFDDVLADPRLGLVSPAALARADGGELGLAQAGDAGSGPYELRERSAQRLLLAPFASWWGSRKALGPALDQVELLHVRSEEERLALLRSGRVQIASGLRPGSEESVAMDPLLTVIAPGVGAERSLRGVPDPETTPALNGVWQTRLDAD